MRDRHRMKSALESSRMQSVRKEILRHHTMKAIFNTGVNKLSPNLVPEMEKQRYEEEAFVEMDWLIGNLTSFRNHWQKAGEIHSRACMPQSMKMTFFLPLSFPTCFLKSFL